MKILTVLIAALVIAVSTANPADAITNRCKHQPHGHAYGWAKQCHRYTTPENAPGVRRDFPITIINL